MGAAGHQGGRAAGPRAGTDHELEISLGRTVTTAEVAVCTQFWRRGGRRSGGPGYESATTAQLVLTFATRWEIAIADPWG